MAIKTELAEKIGNSAFAFRGYNLTNLGRTAELLRHPAYGATVERYLRLAGDICGDVRQRRVDLVARVRRGEETTLATYDEAVSLIVAVEMAQLKLLEELFGIRLADARFVYGYSLGELAAVMATGVFTSESALTVPLAMTEDCVELAHDVTMGVLFSRGPALDLDEVTRLCLRINTQGEGVIGVSTYLAPNTVLLLGQGATVDRFAEGMHDSFPERVHLRKNDHRWPPLHTPIVWQRHVPNRVGTMLHTLSGGMTAPAPPIVSMVTGERSYTDLNSRELLNRWVDHPQRLWDAVYETLASGVETVIHVGPDPNLIPATFRRLSDNVLEQLEGRSLNKIGLRAVARAVRRPWLASLLPSRTALLRAPLVEQIILEDWLLAQPVP
jgi:[acyl-carrier-protein] S-malonyltransferase